MSDLHDEFAVKVHDPEFGFDVSICGLCGNTGHIRTMAVHTPKGLPVPPLYKPCICPNGRGYKEREEANGD